MRPVRMIKTKAPNLAMVKTFCTVATILTLMQLMRARRTMPKLEFFLCQLTDASCSEKLWGEKRRVAVGEERLQHIRRKSYRYGRDCTRSTTLHETFNFSLPDNDALNPHSNEAHQRTERLQDVRIVSTGCLDESSQLRVTVSAHRREDAAYHPNCQ